MALAQAAAMSSVSSFLVRSSVTSAVQSSTTRSMPFNFFKLASATIAIPSISVNIPGLVSDLWEGILRAVPKKKTSHMKRRHRQLAGKALKDVRSVNTCPGCGKPKKAHTLCPYCVAEIQQGWKQAAKASKELEAP